MLRIGVLVSGGGTNLQAIIDHIESGDIKNTEIATVVSNRQNAYALKRANKHHIHSTCIRPKDFKDKSAYTEAMIEHFREKKVDLLVLAGFLVILDEALIKAFRNRIINIHPSLIPAFSGDGYYGLRVHEKALERGVKVTGATVHIVDEITDHGPILYQRAVEVFSDDTPRGLQKRVMEEAEWIILPQAIKEFDKWSTEFPSV